MDYDELQKRFRYHPPNDTTKAMHEEVRGLGIEFAARLDEELPGESREKSLAFTNLEQALFWANAHIARNISRGTEEIR